MAKPYLCHTTFQTGVAVATPATQLPPLLRASLSMFGAIDDKHNLFSEVNRYVQTISVNSFHLCQS